MRKIVALAMFAALLGHAGPGHALGSFTTFETGQVRPLALTPDGMKLLAINTPDARLEIFDVDGSGDLAHAATVPVGMEPIAVAVRSNGEAWVVNHLSDSVSIVDLSSTPPRVVRTLHVGDEPRDLVFAGPGGNRAFVTTAHRGQNTGIPFSDMTTAGVGRADVWVFDANNLGAAMGGMPETVIELFGDTPRPLAVSPDGNTVYAGVFHSGNQTTIIGEAGVCDGGAGVGACNISGNVVPGGLPAPSPLNCAGDPQPETGLIVKFHQGSGQWRDELGRNWSNVVRFNLPDEDVFTINAAADPPVESGTPYAHVGTILFNMIANPVTGKVYVSNTDANNAERFEGPGGCSSTVQGHLHETRITVLDGGAVTPRHLNKHIDYAVLPAPGGVKANSLATPVGMAIDPTGTTLYVAAFGSSKIGVFDTGDLETNAFTPDSGDHIAVSGGGPSGLVLNGNRLYALTRFDNAVKVIDVSAHPGSEIAQHPLFNPEPANVVDGRPVLYDAVNTSSNGEASCASCHVFGDFDSLAWDLGNPDEDTLNNPNPIIFNFGVDEDFAPMKGPMTTQSLRGMDHHGPMHWRGDRTGGNDPGGNALDEVAAFGKFIVAFEGLIGKDTPLATSEMDKFTDFILDVVYPPNPVRALDNVLNGDQALGENDYFNEVSDTIGTCNFCHTLNPAQGFFGSDGGTTFENEPQLFKVAHLRNAYQKIGMFGMAENPFITSPAGDTSHQGDQIRGFGFLHDGAVDTVFRFLSAGVFTSLDNGEQRDLEELVLAFDTTLAPIVGQQVTLTDTNAGAVGGRIDLMIQRAQTLFDLVGHPGARECELIVKGNVAGEARGWLFSSATTAFIPDRAAEPEVLDATLRAMAVEPGQELTYTCVPPGSGVRMGIDRDEDGTLDGDEGGPPPTGFACASAPEPGCRAPGKATLVVKNNGGIKDRFVWKWLKGAATTVADFGAPTAGDDYELCVYDGSGALVTSAGAPAAGLCAGNPCWSSLGTNGFKYKDKDLTPDGLLKVLLRSGDTGKAKVVAKGKGLNLDLPALPIDGADFPLVVQMQGEQGECWSSSFDSGNVIRNDAGQLKAKFAP